MPKRSKGQPDRLHPVVGSMNVAIFKLVVAILLLAAFAVFFVACGKSKILLPDGTHDCVFHESDGEGTQRWVCRMEPRECTVFINSGKFKTQINCGG